MHLAQLNVARLIDDPESEAVAEFMNALVAINLLGEVSPGFVWRLQDEEGAGAVDQRFPGHENDRRFIVNLTVWTDFSSLRHFATRSGHAMYLRRRLEWFEKPSRAMTVLWWVKEGHLPDLEEAADRLGRIRRDGATPDAFDMQTTFFDPGGAG
ncbi:MAG: DUF3291 domain-containing protein [Proteobacteria bacterium]|nr:DUF3291 domain-containing protein [Pseudomonadota bacterium]